MPHITLPIIDLTSKPQKASSDFSHDDLRLTQLLYGEQIKVQKSEGDWLFVHALEQNNYPGWIPTSAVSDAPKERSSHVVSALMTPLDGTLLSYATYLTPQEASRMNPDAIRAIPTTFNPQLMAQEAHLFLGAPYLWGGRSAPLPGKIASVDCSSLINLLYRAQGKLIPRDAHDQCAAATNTAAAIGTPVYLKKSERFNHVVIYLSENLCLESPETGKPVRTTPLTWKDDQVHVGEREGAYFHAKMF